jgi:SAM-dependent methyltransferase
VSSATPEISTVDSGSFRDPESRVFYTGEGVFRALSASGLADWEKLKGSGLYDELAAAGKLVGTDAVAASDVPDGLPGEWAGVLRHETIPFISYPYEWPFGMLQDAALLQLDLLDAALARDLILKDSSSYNVQFRGAQPTFIDVGSFEALRPGEPWIGYRQFCMLFLYPLMLRAYKDVPFQPWLRGSLDGISPIDMRNLMSGDRFKKGVMSHVLLHARLENRYADRSDDTMGEVKKAGFRKELIVANVRKLHKTVERLSWKPDAGAVWVEYGEKNSYSDDEAEQKARFVEAAAATGSWERAWDLGCNDGRFSKIAARHAKQVVAVDGDEGVVEVLYRHLHEEGRTDILPLVMSLTDPSPDRGWMGRERRRLEARGLPDLVLVLALIHHIVITGNVPIASYLDWLRGLDGALVIELPLPDDPMVKRLLANKREGLHQDYTREHFEACLRERFEIERSEELSRGTRVMYFARPR